MTSMLTRTGQLNTHLAVNFKGVMIVSRMFRACSIVTCCSTKGWRSGNLDGFLPILPALICSPACANGTGSTHLACPNQKYYKIQESIKVIGRTCSVKRHMDTYGVHATHHFMSVCQLAFSTYFCKHSLTTSLCKWVYRQESLIWCSFIVILVDGVQIC